MKLKAGPVTGVTALLLIMVCVVFAQVAFFALRNYGLIQMPDDDWVLLALLSSFTTFIGLAFAWFIGRNSHEQGVKKGAYTGY